MRIICIILLGLVGCAFHTPRPADWQALSGCHDLSGVYRNLGEGDGVTSGTGLANELGLKAKAGDRIQINHNGEDLRVTNLVTGHSAELGIKCSEGGWAYSTTRTWAAEGLALEHVTLTLFRTGWGWVSKSRVQPSAYGGFCPLSLPARAGSCTGSINPSNAHLNPRSLTVRCGRLLFITTLFVSAGCALPRVKGDNFKDVEKSLGSS